MSPFVAAFIPTYKSIFAAEQPTFLSSNFTAIVAANKSPIGATYKSTFKSTNYSDCPAI